MSAARENAAPTAPQLGLNSAGVPGGVGFELAEPVTVAGVEWTPEDGAPSACPIGTALAAETARRAES